MKWVLIILLLALVFVFSVYTLTSINRDIGRHLATGEIIWKTHQVPKTNFFSFTVPDFPIVNHHWLGQVFLYLVSIVVGLKGLILFKASVITASFALSFFAFFKKENIFIGSLLALVSIFILVERTDVRPEIFSFLFLAWYIFVLFREDTKLMWSLPIVQLVWVNTHIYFFLGPLLFSLFFISKLVKRETLAFRYSRTFKTGFLLVIVNFINPFFWKGALYPLLVFNNYAISIVENRSPLAFRQFTEFLPAVYFLIFAIAIAIIAVFLNYKNLRKDFFYTAAIIVGITLSFLMIRNLPIFALLFLPITWKNFHEAGVISKTQGFLPVLIIFLGLLIHANITNQFYGVHSVRRFGLHIPNWSQVAVDFVKNNDIHGPVFNNFRIGSFLIWKLPKEKVFIDTRPEAYPASFIRDIYLPMQAEPEKWELYAEKYKINFVFFSYHDVSPSAKKFLEHISTNSQWPLIYGDDSIKIFIKNNPKNSKLIERFAKP